MVCETSISHKCYNQRAPGDHHSIVLISYLTVFYRRTYLFSRPRRLDRHDLILRLPFGSRRQFEYVLANVSIIRKQVIEPSKMSRMLSGRTARVWSGSPESDNISIRCVSGCGEWVCRSLRGYISIYRIAGAVDPVCDHNRVKLRASLVGEISSHITASLWSTLSCGDLTCAAPIDV